MDFVGLDDSENIIGIAEVENSSIETAHFWDIVPKKGRFLGLDISELSSGIALIEDGEKLTANISLNEEVGPHKEVLFRRALKRDLALLIKDKHFDLIVIEDAFVGSNADTVRKLFALNTAIDEMILDGECSCDKFIRVNNKQWKSWLWTLDTNGISKGYNDKEKIRMCLEMIGICEEGEGYQDRLDATGLIAGYFLKGKQLEKNNVLPRKLKVSMSDVEGSYSIESSYLFYGRDDVNRGNLVFLDYSAISKKRVLELLAENPEAVFVTENRILLGNLGIILGLDMIDDGGYFAFWIKPSKVKKYINR